MDKFGFVVLVGAPNAGKSTLINNLVKSKVSITSPKIQTTRSRVLGITVWDQTQVVFIDTPGAYPGVGAEERGQAEAIARSIECSMSIGVPTISIIIGEGGSGGAIALASSSKVIMLENAIYSVISPEGCATILWKDPTKILEAAEAMKLTAKDLLKLGVIDEIISEPVGGAHRDPDLIASDIKHALIKSLNSFIFLV